MDALKRSASIARREPAVLEEAVRALYRIVPDPCGLLEGEDFTLVELQRLHESVLGERVMKDAFRRHMVTMCESTGRTREGIPGKPAALYRLKALVAFRV